MTPTDRINVFLLAKVQALQDVLMFMLNEHPHREKIKSGAEFVIEARQVNASNSAMSDEEIEIQTRARKEVFDAVFHELPPTSMKDSR